MRIMVVITPMVLIGVLLDDILIGENMEVVVVVNLALIVMDPMNERKAKLIILMVAARRHRNF